VNTLAGDARNVSTSTTCRGSRGTTWALGFTSVQTEQLIGRPHSLDTETQWSYPPPSKRASAQVTMQLVV